jgi:hypothetical protein
MIATASAALTLIFAQAAGDRVQAQYPEQQWSLEYPALIGGFVDDYYRCLKGGNYVIGDGSGFEDQYRGDIQRCSKQAEKMETGANELLAKRGRSAATPPADVAAIFDTVRRIHVERGASLDRATRSRIVASNAYAEAREATAAAPPPCVASINALREQRQAHMETQGEAVKAVYDKPEYTQDDQRLIATYNAELMRLTGAITLELRACPEANYRVYEDGAEGVPAEGADG